ncbi:putative RDD family membrane protein YckC [Kitasatospora sp. MAP12-15]|uniref:RDD family protein n=1 Tax=unclassified Kitasatospora TaxID=2633591 RepID=UPI00247587F2|nr:RDD family protein [Kitasatospora sp. MAP12-44]MDH6114837.1 putative RDD family membrane protein YckC [Kitasatospora sp. MAP12-44]
MEQRAREERAANYAYWSLRVISFLIDMLACWMPNIVAGVVDPDNTALQVGLLAVSIALLAFNRWYLAGRTGQSWGKRLMETRLVRLDGGSGSDGEIGVLRSFLRDLAHLLDTLPCLLGWFWPLWDTRRQTFADKLAGTAVADEAESPAAIPAR